MGKAAWGVKVGYGSFLTIEFGVPNKSEYCSIYGEWYLWLYLCSWRIEKDGYLIVGSDDSKEKLIKSTSTIEGYELRLFKVYPQTLDLLLTFENNSILRTFSTIADNEINQDKQHWMLYMPDNRVLVADPGNRWVVEAA